MLLRGGGLDRQIVRITFPVIRPIRPWSHTHTISYRDPNPTMVHIPMAEASATLACLKGLKSSLMCTIVVFLIGIPKNGFGFEDSVGFGFGDWLAADGPLVVAGETLCDKRCYGISRTNGDMIRESVRG